MQGTARCVERLVVTGVLSVSECKVRHVVFGTLWMVIEFCQSQDARRGTMLRTSGLGMGATWNPFIECFFCIVAAVCCECEPARVFLPLSPVLIRAATVSSGSET